MLGMLEMIIIVKTVVLFL